jgi:hypothetical protein
MSFPTLLQYSDKAAVAMLAGPRMERYTSPRQERSLVSILRQSSPINIDSTAGDGGSKKWQVPIGCLRKFVESDPLEMCSRP